MPVSPQQYPQMANMGIYIPCNDNTGTTVKDYSGNGHDFTASNAAIWSTATNDGVSCLFPNASYYATWATGGSADVNFAAGTSFTIEAWANVSDWSTSGVVVEHFSGNPGYQIQIRATEKMGIYVRDTDGTAIDMNTDAAVAINEWHHYAIVVDRGTSLVYWYLDGVSQDTPASTAALGAITPNETLGIGADGSGGAIITGYVNNVAIWPIARHNFGYTRSGVDL